MTIPRWPPQRPPQKSWDFKCWQMNHDEPLVLADMSSLGSLDLKGKTVRHVEFSGNPSPSRGAYWIYDRWKEITEQWNVATCARWIWKTIFILRVADLHPTQPDISMDSQPEAAVTKMMDGWCIGLLCSTPLLIGYHNSWTRNSHLNQHQKPCAEITTGGDWNLQQAFLHVNFPMRHSLNLVPRDLTAARPSMLLSSFNGLNFCGEA